MTTAEVEELQSLYECDETAWLERMAELVSERRFEELDLSNLHEFLTSMARRDKREVESRLAILLTHLLKWSLQLDHRTGSWRATIEVLRHELELLLQSGTLWNHAEQSLAASYHAALRQASSETGLPANSFPATCPYTVDELIALPDLA